MKFPFPLQPAHRPRPGFQVVRSRRALREALKEAAEAGWRVGLVPTMGGLHEGHLRLIDIARGRADLVAASIFVNPLQFGPDEDLERYPRRPLDDIELLQSRGTNLVFIPEEEEMYPSGGSGISVDPGPLAARLCGLHRPGHFRGVLTVVAKLLGLFGPSVAVFGRKDLQQAVLIRHMAEEFSLPIEIVTGPLVREADGLAMSSRNAYLSPLERTRARALFEALSAADASFRAGEVRPHVLLAEARGVLAGTPGLREEYLELVDPETLEEVERARAGTVLALAVHLGTTRLIDNLVLGSEVPDPRVETATPDEADG